MPLFSQRTRYYEIETKIELVDMARIFFNDTGRVLFFLCFAIYLYGDLSIYAAAVAKTLRDVIWWVVRVWFSHPCVLITVLIPIGFTVTLKQHVTLIWFCFIFHSTRNSAFGNATDDELDAQPCWMNADPVGQWANFTRLDCYRLSLIGFISLLGPFTFFNVQKTKYIQMCTILLRWMAFSIMISIAVRRLMVNGAQGDPPVANAYGMPSLFGTCVYSFMCHHSLPSLVAPIRDKGGLHKMLSADYMLIASFYLFLAMTGAFAFAHLEDLYTLNFIPTAKQSDYFLVFIEYFLALFPVFTLSASFPIIAITLRNNLEALFMGTTSTQTNGNPDAAYASFCQFLLRRCTFPLLAILPPIVITYFTDSLASLVSFTGSYAGTGIQYIIPVALVWQARKTCRQILGQGIINDFRSPFQSVVWLIFVFVWSCTSVILVTVNFLTHSIHQQPAHLGIHLTHWFRSNFNRNRIDWKKSRFFFLCSC